MPTLPPGCCVSTRREPGDPATMLGFPHDPWRPLEPSGEEKEQASSDLVWLPAPPPASWVTYAGSPPLSGLSAG